MKHLSSIERKVKFFTLIELLVVVAIIAILAGMLLPALSNARETGIQTTCMNQHKTFAFAVHTYADENGGFAPRIKVAPPANALDACWASNRRFLDIAGVQYNKTGGDGKWSHYWNSKYVCPKVQKFADNGGTIVGPYYYGFQNKIGQGTNDYWSENRNIKISTMIVNPSAKVMIFDALQAPDNGGVSSTAATSRATYLTYKDKSGAQPVGSDNYASYLGFRHLNDSRVVMSFYDGHVASLDEGRVIITNNLQWKPRMYWFSKR